MGHQRIYLTEEDFQKRNKKHYSKYRGYFKIYYKYYYLKKKIEELEKAPISKSKKFDEIILTIKNQESRENGKE
jgi:hypothetical protein